MFGSMANISDFQTIWHMPAPSVLFFMHPFHTSRGSCRAADFLNKPIVVRLNATQARPKHKKIQAPKNGFGSQTLIALPVGCP
eukprot:6422479-Amphidinium_carterae.1